MKKIIKFVLPTKLFKKLSKFKKVIDGYDLNHPVAQIYINTNVQSSIGINNFYSVLAPMTEIVSKVRVVFYDKDGKIVLRTSIRLSQWASLFLDVKDFFTKHNVYSDLGIVSVSLLPVLKFKNFNLLKFGYMTSHFFMFYRSKDYKSLSHIHPLSTLDPTNQKAEMFVTSQRIFLNGLSFVKLYQMNPSSIEHEIACTFTSNTGEEIVKMVSIPANGVREVVFFPNEFKRNETIQFYFSISPLPSSNAKPMLMRVFEDGLFSMSHC